MPRFLRISWNGSSVGCDAVIDSEAGDYAAIAERLGYEERPGRAIADAFMQELYQHARDTDAVVESFWDRVTHWFGAKEFEFETHPEFTKIYIVKGTDEEGIRAIFTDSVLEYFGSRPNRQVERIRRH